MAVDGMINFDMCQGQLVPREAFFRNSSYQFSILLKVCNCFILLKERKRSGKRDLVGCITTKYGIIQRTFVLIGAMDFCMEAQIPFTQIDTHLFGIPHNTWLGSR